jgi:hypothetical protein
MMGVFQDMKVNIIRIVELLPEDVFRKLEENMKGMHYSGLLKACVNGSVGYELTQMSLNS